jgi:hypothetical protein
MISDSNPIIPAIVQRSTSLAELACQAKLHHAEVTASESTALIAALAAGKVLLEAKSVVPHGSFLEWVEVNTGIGRRRAQVYASLAEQEGLLGSPRNRGPMSIRQATKTINDLQTLKSHLPGPGQRVKATFGDWWMEQESVPGPGDGFVGLLGSVRDPGFVYVAVHAGDAKGEEFTDWTRKPYRADGTGLCAILQFILKNPEQEDDHGPDDFEELVWFPPEDAGPFCEMMKGQIGTVPWDHYWVEPDVILGIKRDESVTPVQAVYRHYKDKNGDHLPWCFGCMHAKAAAERNQSISSDG